MKNGKNWPCDIVRVVAGYLRCANFSCILARHKCSRWRTWLLSDHDGLQRAVEWRPMIIKVSYWRRHSSQEKSTIRSIVVLSASRCGRIPEYLVNSGLKSRKRLVHLSDGVALKLGPLSLRRHVQQKVTLQDHSDYQGSTFSSSRLQEHLLGRFEDIIPSGMTESSFIDRDA